LGGSLAAFIVGSATTLYFYGKVVPETPTWSDDPVSALSYFGHLEIPSICKISGWSALGAASLATGLIGSVSELIDVFGLDDNVIIPIVSAAGIWGFFKLFAS